MKNRISFIALICLGMGLLSACGSPARDSSSAPPAGFSGNEVSASASDVDNLVSDPSDPFKIVRDQVELSVATTQFDESLPPDEQWIWKFLQERTNLKLNVRAIAGSVWPEQKGIIMSSGNLPDLFVLYSGSFENHEMVSYAQNSGLFLDLSPYIDDYAPDVKREFDRDPSARKAVTLPDGKIYSLPAMRVGVDNIQTAGSPVGNTWINGKWIEDLGLTAPETLDDLYEVLKAFKDGDPNGNGIADEIPISGDKTSTRLALIIRAFGFNTADVTSLCIKDDKVVLPAADPLYAEYLTYMRRLYSEDLIDHSFFTQTGTECKAKCSQGLVGMRQTTAAFTEFPETYEDFIYASPLTSQWNDKKIITLMNTVTPTRFVISSKTEHPEICVRLGNLYFLDMLNPIIEGPEKGSGDEFGFGGHYADENGCEVFEMPENCSSGWEYRYKYLGTYDGGTPGLNNSVHRGEKYAFPAPDLLFREQVYSIKPEQYFQPDFPILYMSAEESERNNSLITPLKDYINMMEAKFITGSEPLDSIDAYFQKLKDLGADEYLALNQKAYDQLK